MILTKIMAGRQGSSREDRLAILEKLFEHMTDQFGSDDHYRSDTHVDGQVLRNRKTGHRASVHGGNLESLHKGKGSSASLLGRSEHKAIKREASILVQEMTKELIAKKQAAAPKKSWSDVAWGLVGYSSDPKLSKEEKKAIQRLAHELATDLVVARASGKRVELPSEMKMAEETRALKSDKSGLKAIFTVLGSIAGGMASVITSHPIASIILGGLANLSVQVNAEDAYTTVCETLDRCITKNLTSVNPVVTRVQTIGACNAILEQCSVSEVGRSRINEAVTILTDMNVTNDAGEFSAVFQEFFPCLHEAHNCRPSCDVVFGDVLLGGPPRNFTECRNVSSTTTSTSTPSTTSSTSMGGSSAAALSTGALAGIVTVGLLLTAFALGLMCSSTFRSCISSCLGRKSGNVLPQHNPAFGGPNAMQMVANPIALHYEAPVKDDQIQRQEGGDWKQWSQGRWVDVDMGDIDPESLQRNARVEFPDGELYTWDGERNFIPVHQAFLDVTYTEPTLDHQIQCNEGVWQQWVGGQWVGVHIPGIKDPAEYTNGDGLDIATDTFTWDAQRQAFIKFERLYDEATRGRGATLRRPERPKPGDVYQGQVWDGEQWNPLPDDMIIAPATYEQPAQDQEIRMLQGHWKQFNAHNGTWTVIEWDGPQMESASTIPVGDRQQVLGAIHIYNGEGYVPENLYQRPVVAQDTPLYAIPEDLSDEQQQQIHSAYALFNDPERNTKHVILRKQPDQTYAVFKCPKRDEPVYEVPKEQEELYATFDQHQPVYARAVSNTDPYAVLEDHVLYSPTFNQAFATYAEPVQASEGTVFKEPSTGVVYVMNRGKWQRQGASNA